MEPLNKAAIPQPQQIFSEMGLEPATIKRVDTLSERHGHAVWRVVTAACTYVLKWLPEADAGVEVQGYLLLRRIGVPTLPLYGHTSQALLMEDLTRSERWRLAVAGDLSRPAVGRAVARWYRRFHEAGEVFLSQGERPDFLARETDVLDPKSILATGRALDLSHLRVWELAAAHIEALKAAVEGLGVTLNYNDFYWTNLALSIVARSGAYPLAVAGLLTEPPLAYEPEAVVFDYHLLGVGMRYSDCRNVTHALSGDAVRSFWEVYGDVDPREGLLDAPLSTLYGLHVASRMQTFPAWAEGSLKRVVNGDLERDLIAAMDVIC